MIKPGVLGYTLKEEVLAETRFDDGMYLQIVPKRKDGSVIGFDSGLLFSEKGMLQAMVVDRIFKEWAGPECSGYWSKGITQQEFADYWYAAIEGVDDLDNDIALIVIRGAGARLRLEQGKERIFGKV